jgi:hypothetical protein
MQFAEVEQMSDNDNDDEDEEEDNDDEKIQHYQTAHHLIIGV